MRSLPDADSGDPDHRSASRYLWWLARRKLPSLIAGMACAVVWMGAQALMPAAIGRAIDAGIVGRDARALMLWAGVLFVLGATQALFGLLRHRMAVYNWLSAAYTTIQLTVRQSAGLGGSLSRRLVTGDVVAIGTADIAYIGDLIDIIARASGALVAIVLVTAILLTTSLPLGLVVVGGVPAMMGVVALLIRPLHRRQNAHREQQGELTNRATDIVAGLRVLRGIGGEDAFARRYREESQRLRVAGTRVASVDSYLEAAQVLIPGVFVAVVTWLAARFALGGRISAGQLVAFYAYAQFLVGPLQTLTETVDKFTRGHVAARRVVRVLSLAHDLADGPGAALPDPDGDLVDPESGFLARGGLLTAIAATEPRDAARIAERLGRQSEGEATLGGVPLARLRRDQVRDLVLVADNDAHLFTGTVSGELDPGGVATPARIAEALYAASAQDITEALPQGLDAPVAEGGREFSGGQQQRLRLARALVVDPPALVLIEPTSAVDAHTEARIGERLRAARTGRTTVVTTTSPLLLDRVDQVSFVDGGRVAARGTHRELLASVPGYAALVLRGEG